MLICGDWSNWPHFHVIMPVMPDKAVFVSSAALCTALPGKLLYLPLQKQHLVPKNEFEFLIQTNAKRPTSFNNNNNNLLHLYSALYIYIAFI